MPLVRIDIKKYHDGSYIKKLGKVVYEAMKTAINVPDKDNFQVLAEHDDNHFVYDPTYLGIVSWCGFFGQRVRGWIAPV